MDIKQLKAEMQQCLQQNILDYWLERMTDHEHGGYYGRIDGHDRLDATAPKGAVLNARILWSFAAAYRVLGKPEYLDTAIRARDYIIDHFIDHEQGGVYWSVDYLGQPLDTKKQTYAIGFAIYGMSELARATGDKQALDCAIALYHDIEKHAYDAVNGGYREALTRDWQPIADMRLSAKDENGSKTMNTHLHVIEPYTNLYRVWPLPELQQSIYRLLDVFSHRFYNPVTHHLDLFFDDEWQGRRNIQSFGHDIEATWLLYETLLVLGDQQAIDRLRPLIASLAQAADEGLCPDGSMIYERWTDSGETDRQRQWWVQCENIIGHTNLYQYYNDREALDIVFSCWQYVKEHLIDRQNGEWHWAIDDRGNINLDDDKAGFWKCPYHNTRMCLEILERTL
jgi:N-acyl-D-glucosamine 2-epimerase